MISVFERLLRATRLRPVLSLTPRQEHLEAMEEEPAVVLTNALKRTYREIDGRISSASILTAEYSNFLTARRVVARLIANRVT